MQHLFVSPPSEDHPRPGDGYPITLYRARHHDCEHSLFDGMELEAAKQMPRRRLAVTGAGGGKDLVVQDPHQYGQS
jgi:hypothetical protein